MNKERVVESDKVVSEDEQKIQKALSSICSLLSSSNANQLELECNQFDKLVRLFIIELSLDSSIFRKATFIRSNNKRFCKLSYRLYQSMFFICILDKSIEFNSYTR